MQTRHSHGSSRASWTRCWLAALTCALFALALTSCATGTTATRDAPPPTLPSPPPGPQASQLRQCPPLPPARSDLVPDLLQNHGEVAALYHDCASRTDSLLQSIEAWQATAWRWYCQAVQRAGYSDAACSAAAK